MAHLITHNHLNHSKSREQSSELSDMSQNMLFFLQGHN